MAAVLQHCPLSVLMHHEIQPLVSVSDKLKVKAATGPKGLQVKHVCLRNPSKSKENAVAGGAMHLLILKCWIQCLVQWHPVEASRCITGTASTYRVVDLRCLKVAPWCWQGGLQQQYIYQSYISLKWDFCLVNAGAHGF